MSNTTGKVLLVSVAGASLASLAGCGVWEALQSDPDMMQAIGDSAEAALNGEWGTLVLSLSNAATLLLGGEAARRGRRWRRKAEECDRQLRSQESDATPPTKEQADGL